MNEPTGSDTPTNKDVLAEHKSYVITLIFPGSRETERDASGGSRESSGRKAYSPLISRLAVDVCKVIMPAATTDSLAGKPARSRSHSSIQDKYYRQYYSDLRPRPLKGK